jgi:hypothetical protein
MTSPLDSATSASAPTSINNDFLNAQRAEKDRYCHDCYVMSSCIVAHVEGIEVNYVF